LGFPAGHVDLGETVTQSAVREIREELGVTLDPADLMSPISMFRRSLEPRVDYFFATTHWQGDPGIREPHKCTELVWVLRGSPDVVPCCVA
jgi:8-oxo-dGTP diphosphatase